MSDTIFKAGPQTYGFEFGCDGKIYSTYFSGAIPPGMDSRILEEVRRHLFKESSKTIRSYLEQNNIKYSHFCSGVETLEHGRIMEAADSLLRSRSASKIESRLRECNHYYAAMDHQKKTGSSHYAGCYYAVKRISDAYAGISGCKVIGQTYEENDGNLQGYFAIRESRDNQCLYDIEKVTGEPPFPAFGCVDVLNLLVNIDTIETVYQAQKAALR